MECKQCLSFKTIKSGRQKNGTQKYQCKVCGIYFQKSYRYQSCTVHDKMIIQLTKEGCGIRSTSRILNISATTVITRILKIAKYIEKPPISFGKSYQVDELITFIGNKQRKYCVVYAFDPENKTVACFAVGRRNKNTLKQVVNTVLLSEAKQIATDKLNHYEALIPKALHNVKRKGTNHIERHNLNLRTHLKRLNRRTICYSKSLSMLAACVMIYFWL